MHMHANIISILHCKWWSDIFWLLLIVWNSFSLEQALQVLALARLLSYDCNLVTGYPLSGCDVVTVAS